jgi:hypothetical protein
VPRVKKGVKVVMHHSRDTAAKQWSETRVLTMQGMGRLHRTFMRHLRQEGWYKTVWTQTLEIGRSAAVLGSQQLEVALAGIGLLFSMLQLASRAGLAHAPLRAVVGMKVVDGSLQSLAEAPREKKEGSRPDKDMDAFEASKVGRLVRPVCSCGPSVYAVKCCIQAYRCPRAVSLTGPVVGGSMGCHQGCLGVC